MVERGRGGRSAGKVLLKERDALGGADRRQPVAELAVGRIQVGKRRIGRIAQRDRHGFRGVQNAEEQTERLLARTGKVVNVNVAVLQAGIRDERFRDGHQVVRGQIPRGKEGFAFPVEQGKVLELLPQKVVLGELPRRRVEIVGRDAALLEPPDARVHRGRKALALGRAGKELQPLAPEKSGSSQHHAAAAVVQIRQIPAAFRNQPFTKTVEAEHVDAEQPAETL